jgi:hypothetical protein
MMTAFAELRSKFDESQRRFKSVAVIGLILLLSGTSAAQLNLYRLSPKPEVVDGIHLPRNHHELYRGMNEDQMTYQQAVLAMLGDETKRCEAALYTVIREALMNRQSPLADRLNGVRQEIAAFGLSPVFSKQHRALGVREAMDEAERIMSDAISPEKAQAFGIDYLSSTRLDWPRSFLYSTAYIEIAKIYGPQVLIFDESKKPRSIDLNFWNKVNRGVWVHTNLAFPDKGEFLTPFYIPADQIVGYQYSRQSYDRNAWNVWHPLSADITLLFMKYEFKGERYVMIFAPIGLDHVVQVDQVFCGAVSRFDPNAGVPQFAAPDCRKKPLVVGVARLCSKTSPNQKLDDDATSTSCGVPDSIFAPYKASSKAAPGIIRALESLSVGNNKVVVVLPPERRPKKPAPSPAVGEQAASVTGTEVAAQVVALAPTPAPQPMAQPPAVAVPTPPAPPIRKTPDEIVEALMPKSGAKKISTCAQAADTLDCDLSGVVLRPNEEFYISMPDVLQGKSLKGATLWHRQDPATEQGLSGRWDKTPGYSSIQCHSPASKDPWRYFGGPNPKKVPKGSLFADIVADNAVQPQRLDFAASSHKGVAHNAALTGRLLCDAVRVQSVGADPVIFKRIVLEFQ